jgi:predicted dehydrogenase
MDVPCLAVVGCGAIAELFHLPALARHREAMSRAVLVDPNTVRAADLAQRFGAGGIAASLDEVLDRIDGALILTPHRLHFPLALQCLRRGKHVLSEKPLAESATEVDQLVREAADAGVWVAVNNTRRLIPAYQAVHDRVDRGSIGVVRRIEILFGEPFDWPIAGDGYFGPRGGGRGVLADLGAHVLDLACWWLGTEPSLHAYHDDSFGGTEAVAQVDLRGPESTLSIRVSWLSKLANSYRVEGSEATLEGSLYDFRSFTVRRGSRASRERVEGSDVFAEYGHVLLDNFLDVAAGRSTPLVSAADVRPSIALIEACYANRRRFDLPWHDAYTRLLDD